MWEKIENIKKCFNTNGWLVSFVNEDIVHVVTTAISSWILWNSEKCVLNNRILTFHTRIFHPQEGTSTRKGLQKLGLRSALAAFKHRGILICEKRLRFYWGLIYVIAHYDRQRMRIYSINPKHLCSIWMMPMWISQFIPLGTLNMKTFFYSMNYI
jgi:hypothetical protein